MPHIISLATSFTGNYKHLKRNIKEILKRRGVGHIIQTTQANDSQKLTSLYMEGESTALRRVQAELVSQLLSVFPGICIQDWRELASDSLIFDFQSTIRYPSLVMNTLILGTMRSFSLNSHFTLIRKHFQNYEKLFIASGFKDLDLIT